MKTLLVLVFLCSSSCLLRAAQFFIPNGDVTALRTAITTSNSNVVPDTIHLFPYGIYMFTTIDNNFVHGANALPRIAFDTDLANSLTILGNGSKLILDTTVLSEVRLLYIEGGDIRIYDVSFINGEADYDNNEGGAMYVGGSGPVVELDIYNCLFQGNSAYMGGAIYVSTGTVTVENSTLIHNSALFLGSAITNFAGYVYLRSSVVAYNTSTNTSSPGALYNYYPLNSPAFTNIYVSGSIVALNTYENSSSPNDGKEFDLAAYSGIYSWSLNFIGSYYNTTPGTTTSPFVVGSPTSSFDYVGSEASPIDPMFGAFARHGGYTGSYVTLPGSLANVYQAGTAKYINYNPAIASSGLVPSTAEEGEEITIYGRNLSGVDSVGFNGVMVTTGFTATDTSLVVTVPVGVLNGKITIYDASAPKDTSHQEFTLYTEPVTGISAAEKETAFSFYPNPVSDWLYVDSEEVVSVCDLYGKALLISTEGKVNVSALWNGVYLIRSGGEVRKFVKK